MPRGISGNQGYISFASSDIRELTKWTADKDFGVNTYNSRDSAGWQKTIVGNKKFSGTLEGKIDVDDSIEDDIDTESLVALQLHQNTANYWAGNGRVSNFSITCDPDTGEPQTWSCSWESDGSWAKT
tara:strand:+ start:310 stop:690 length:381 start_codon:yes stop_codon:yes gene_type:complete